MVPKWSQRWYKDRKGATSSQTCSTSKKSKKEERCVAKCDKLRHGVFMKAIIYNLTNTFIKEYIKWAPAWP